MKTTVNEYDFVKAFDDMGRGNNFSYEGRVALFNWLSECEEEHGEEIELDVIAFCCEYSEYENLEAFQKEYGEEYKSIDDIEEKTFVIRIDDESFIIQVF